MLLLSLKWHCEFAEESGFAFDVALRDERFGLGAQS